MIYISLTTVPLRLKYWEVFKQGLDSLLNQKTDKDYKVILNIPQYYAMNNNEEYVIPNELAECEKNNPRLVINRDTPDYGPIIKVYGALKYSDNPDDIIIVCDDDHIYHEEMLEYHVKKLNEHHNTAICFRGDMAVDKRDWIEDGVKKYVMRSDNILFPVNRDCYLMIPGHWHSVGYWRHFFQDDFNPDLFALGDGDDPLIGYYFKKHEILILAVVWDKQTDFRPIIDPVGYLAHYHFPIVQPLGYPERSGGDIIRDKSDDSGHGRLDMSVRQFLGDNAKVYIEQPKKRDFINLLQPHVVFHNSVPMKKIHLGPSEDGGYVVPEFIFRHCTSVFSYGIGNDSRFEEEFGLKYKKPAYMFDHTIRRLDTEIENRPNQAHHWREDEKRWARSNCHFYEHGLGFGDNLRDFNADYKKINPDGRVLLKIDIEGGEYDYFEQVDLTLFKSGVVGLLLEVHHIQVPENRKRLEKILRKLTDDFILCHIHGNNWGELWSFKGQLIPVTLELTFINRNVVERYEIDSTEYPIEGLDIPNNPNAKDYKLDFLSSKPLKTSVKNSEGTGLKISIGDMVDRYTICKLKSERTEIDNSKELQVLWNGIVDYDGITPYIDKLYKLHGEIWDLESDIRKGNEDVLGLEEVGRRAIVLRDMNKIRIRIKNEINSVYGEGFVELKINHGSEVTPSIVVSLTTVPERLNNPHEEGIMRSIKSLCEQTDTDYEVHFNIPKNYHVTGEKYVIPEWLNEFKLKYLHLKVFRTEDFGPPTKMVPTLLRIKDPETILLVVDDDLVYHKDMVTEHRRYQEEIKDSCICYEGRETAEPPGYGGLRDAWILCVDKIIEVFMFQHYKSASYKKKLFDQDFFDYYLGKTFSDDILLSRYFNHKGIKIFVVPYDPETPNYATFELWEKNHGVETFPVIKCTHNIGASGCNHPGLLELPTGGRFYEPNNFGKK